ncbi:hypothetical protein ACFL1U_00075 [Patescibacteria group bacterium]
MARINPSLPLYLGIILLILFIGAGIWYFLAGPNVQYVPGDTTPATTGVDSDGDGVFDDAERDIHKTDPFNPDTDGDGFSDGTEIANGFDPLVPSKKTTE